MLVTVMLPLIPTLPLFFLHGSGVDLDVCCPCSVFQQPDSPMLTTLLVPALTVCGYWEEV